MEEVTLSAAVLVVSGVVILRRCGGLFALPFVSYCYLFCLYLGAVSFYLQQGSDTYLHVVLAGAALALGVFLGGNNPLRKLPEKPQLGSNPLRKPPKKPQKQVILEVGLHPKIFEYTLVVITPISLLLSLEGVQDMGIPLLSNNVTLQMVRVSSGPLHRLILTLGNENLLFLGLGWFVLYRLRGKKLFLVLCVLSLLGGLFFISLLGSKAAGVAVMVWFFFGVFYFTRRMPKPGTLAVMGGVALVTTYVVTSYHYLPVPGMNPLAFFYDRLTRVAADALNFLITQWSPRFGHAGFWPFRAEINRGIANVTGGPKPVLFNEYIWDLQNGYGPFAITGLSDALSLYGTGIACYGIAGGVLFVGLFGFACQKLNCYLLSVKRINFLLFAAIIYLMYAMFIETWIAGMPIIAMQSFAVTAVPKFALFLAVYGFLALPFRIPLNRSSRSRKGLDGIANEGKAEERGTESSSPIGASDTFAGTQSG